ncbi:MAG TPA: hypothetical protein VK359_04965, partial [Rubrobacteraceae bacterium]|nr:hypothetical protein [Rubrobacteraceae bacterium]
QALHLRASGCTRSLALRGDPGRLEILGLADEREGGEEPRYTEAPESAYLPGFPVRLSRA